MCPHCALRRSRVDTTSGPCLVREHGPLRPEAKSRRGLPWIYAEEMSSNDRRSAGSELSPKKPLGDLVRQHWASGGVLHRNAWFHDWLLAHDITDGPSAYKAAKDPGLLDDLVTRAAAQETEPVDIPSGRGIVAGRALDLTGYLTCGHPDCLTKQVDRLFSRVWHYFDNIAIVGPDAHTFLEQVSTYRGDTLARIIAGKTRPIFHVRDIGADGLVTWIAKPPSCAAHWKDFDALKAYDYPAKAVRALASTLLSEGTVRLEKKGKSSVFILRHSQFPDGTQGLEQQELLRLRHRKESVEEALARQVAERIWAAAASDLYAAHSMGLPLGIGIGLEAKLTGTQHASISPADVAFRLQLPVVDGLPVRELIALRENEYDAFENFRDTLTRAIKERLAAAKEAEDIDNIVREIKEDEIEPALHKIRQRLNSAEGVLRKNHRYNIGLAGLATTCGLIGAPPAMAISLGVAAMTGAAAVEAKLVVDKKDVSLEGMYFLWQVKEHAEKRAQAPKRAKRRGKR
jgi:hypothetical protein